MKMHPRPFRGTIVPGAVFLTIAALSGASAEDLDRAMEGGARTIELSQASQERIGRTVDETRDLETEYKTVLKNTDGLRVYNEYMDRQIADQIEELAELRRSIDRVSSVERQVMPLMIRMLDGLERFVELDVPFLREERTQRVADLRALMERADVSTAQKFRSLTEAYQIENDFGRTIEAYKDTIEISGARLEVNVLRIGRIGLYYQTADASVTGMWDAKQGSWIPLTDTRSRSEVRRGLKIARKQVAPDLLLLHVPASEGA